MNLANPYHETDWHALDCKEDLILSKLHREIFIIAPDVIDTIVHQFEFVGQHVKNPKTKDLLFDALCAVAITPQTGEPE